MSPNESAKGKFHPGQLVATPGAIKALQTAEDLDNENRSLINTAVINGCQITY